MKIRTILLLVISIIVVTACQKGIDTPPVEFPQQLGKGMYIVNQGNYTVGNASLSFYRYDSAKMIPNVFYERNGIPLGDVAQSMTFWRTYAFIVVNNSGTIWTINTGTGKIVAKLGGLTSPRYIQVIDAEKAYVSDLYSKGITVFNPQTMSPVGSIATGKSTEHLLLYNNKVFAANWSSYNQTAPNNTVQIIDAGLDRLTDSIVVAKEPNSMVLDKHNKLWVLCSGGFLNEEIPALFRIDATTHLIEKRFNFPSLTMSPDQLKINKGGDTLFFLNQGVFRMPVSSSALPEQPFIAQQHRNFYALFIEQATGRVHVTDAGNYMQSGYVFRYQPDGMLIDSLRAGVIPGFIGFN